MKNKNYKFRGRVFTPKEIKQIKRIIKKCWSFGRARISRLICEELNWRQTTGRLKEVACREALRKMEKLRLIKLPCPSPCRRHNYIKRLKAEMVNFKEPRHLIQGSIKDLSPLWFEPVKEKKQAMLWRYLIQRYHYLGYRRTVGRYLRYFVFGKNELIALLGFGDGIYHHHLRDSFIGWDKTTQERNLHLIINNVRFLILPWVRIKNLASKILGQVRKIVPKDWENKYGYEPLLLETFVDVDRFKGTCYKAANWTCLGRTKGKGRSGLRYFFHGKIREYYVYPLVKDALNRLKRSDGV